VVASNRWLTAAVSLLFAVSAIFVPGCASSGTSPTHAAAFSSATSAPRIVVRLPTKPTGVTFVAFANSDAGASRSFERLLSAL
jgi:hypothetical protein